MRKKIMGLLSACGLVFGLQGNVSVEANAGFLYDPSLIDDYVWEGNYCYQESVMVVREKDGSIKPISLLYDIDSIEVVKSATLTKTFKEDVDYRLEDGKLVIIDGGSIPTFTYDEFYPNTGTAGFEDVNGGYICFHEGAYFHERQIVVSYYHNDKYESYIPEGKGKYLPKFNEALKNKEDLDILVYGDSISTGGNSSGHPQIRVSPLMPIYPEQIKNALIDRYEINNINLINESVGGTDSAWGLSNLRTNITSKHDNDFNLIILAFGMNDVLTNAEKYANNMSRIVNALKSKYKNAEFVIIAPMLANERAKNFFGNQQYFHDELLKLEENGVVVTDMTKVHQGLLTRKRFFDMTGNNVNHANDYMARIYAQSVLKTLEISDYELPSEEIENQDTSESATPIEESESISIVEDSNSTIEVDESSNIDSTPSSELPSNIEESSDKNVENDKKGCSGSMKSFMIPIIIINLLMLLLLRKRRVLEK